MPDLLNRFNKETQEIISQWFNNAKNNNDDNLEVEDTYIDSTLLVIEWNDAGLQNRNVQKTNVIASMYENILKRNYFLFHFFNYVSISYSSIQRLSTSKT